MDSAAFKPFTWTESIKLNKKMWNATRVLEKMLLASASVHIWYCIHQFKEVLKDIQKDINMFQQLIGIEWGSATETLEAGLHIRREFYRLDHNIKEFEQNLYEKATSCKRDSFVTSSTDSPSSVEPTAGRRSSL